MELITGDAVRVTVFLGDADTWRGGSLAVALVSRCRELGLAGATLIRGTAGLGANREFHHGLNEITARNLPVRLEIVDLPQRIDRLLPVLDAMIPEGLVTIRRVRVVGHSARQAAAAPG